MPESCRAVFFANLAPFRDVMADLAHDDRENTVLNEANVRMWTRGAGCQILRCRRIGPLWFELLLASGWFRETTMQNLPPPPRNIGNLGNTCAAERVPSLPICGPLRLLIS